MDEDLGVLAGRLVRRLVAEEEPILRAAGLTMWEYVVLDRLARAGVATQAELSRRTRRDPTRLIRHLDRLADRELIVREVSGADRRARTVALSQRGRALHAEVKSGIRAMESDLLAALGAGRAAEFRRDLAALGATAEGDQAP